MEVGRWTKCSGAEKEQSFLCWELVCPGSPLTITCVNQCVHTHTHTQALTFPDLLWFDLQYFLLYDIAKVIRIQ